MPAGYGGNMVLQVQQRWMITSAVSQLVYMPNFRAIGQSVWEKNGNIQTDRNTHTQTDLNFIKIDRRGTLFGRRLQSAILICFDSYPS